MDSDQEEETRPQSPLSISHYQAQIRALDTTIRNLNTTIQSQNATIARLRESRGIHRSNVQTLTTTNTALTITNAELEAQIKALTVKEEAISEAIAEPLDSDVDVEDQPIKLEKKKTSVITSTGKTHVIAPTTNSDTSTIITGNNKKYPDVPYFYGEKEKWDEWRFHLDAKFRQSAVSFPTERDKIDYIRDHCKSIAFGVIKARADPLSEDPYTTAKEMIQELHSMFGEYDQLAKCSAMLHDPAFGMGVSKENRKETFDHFYARFSATVAPLSYSDSHRITALKRLITTKLQLRIVGMPATSFRSFVEHLRKTDQDLRQLEAMDVEEIDEDEFRSGRRSRSRSPPPEQYSEQLKAQLKKEGRCLKCLGHGHRPNKTEACRKTTSLSFEEAKALLAKEEKAKEKAVEKE
ncbi:hypothetical protein BDR22DRAFT_973071 [Usnea florida]